MKFEQRKDNEGKKLLGGDGDHSLTHTEIELMRKKMSAHRNIMEQERKFIRAV